MLLEFSVGNYRSFFTIQTLDFRSTSLVSEFKDIDQNNIIEKGGQKILKTVGLYGPNGSGKSNLVRALKIFCELVERSLESEVVMAFAADPFTLTNENPEHRGFFQVQLLIDLKKYRYGFTLDQNGGVLEEWLFGPAEKNETWYFKRTHGSIESNKEWFEEGYRLPFENLRGNTLFLTFASAYNGSISQAIRDFIVKSISFEKPNIIPVRKIQGLRNMDRVVSLNNRQDQTNQLVKGGKTELVLDWLKRAGLIYSNISIEDRLPYIETVLLEKNVFDKEGKISSKVVLNLDENESAGTRKFYSYIGWLYNLFMNGGILISDEIDNNFHPSLLQQIIGYFNNPSINLAGAQLLFTSHDTNLLQPEILRRDQIYFAEKSSNDESILYSLADLKGIRNNADFARQYLAGFYGALPILDHYRQ